MLHEAHEESRRNTKRKIEKKPDSLSVEFRAFFVSLRESLNKSCYLAEGGENLFNMLYHIASIQWSNHFGKRMDFPGLTYKFFIKQLL